MSRVIRFSASLRSTVKTCAHQLASDEHKRRGTYLLTKQLGGIVSRLLLFGKLAELEIGRRFVEMGSVHRVHDVAQAVREGAELFAEGAFLCPKLIGKSDQYTSGGAPLASPAC